MATQPMTPTAGHAPGQPFAVPVPVGGNGQALPAPVPAAVPVPVPGATPDNPVELEAQPAAVPGGFWQQPWVQNILPFVTSLSLHAAVIILGLLTIGVYKVVTAPAAQEQVIIPDSTLATEGPPGGVPNVGLNDDPFRQAMQDRTPDGGTPEGFAEKKGPTVDISAAGGGSGDTADAVIGVGPGGGFGKGSGLGTGAGDARGTGNSDGSGAVAPFGTPGGGALGVKGPVFGHSGNARLITFVCDASGSMINKMASLKQELSKAIVGLRPIQSFSVIFFQDDKCSYLDQALVPATPENKRKADKFLEGVTTTGTTDPIPGIELAFKQHPQLIFLLTDGDFPDNKKVLDRIRDLNKDKRVKINTIAFVSSADTDVAFIDLLKTIAKENGGVFKHVKEDEL